MSDIYTGVRVIDVHSEIINELYANKEIKLFDKRRKWQQNLYVVLKDESGGQQSALGRVKENKIVLLKNDMIASGIRPRNKEQTMAMEALLDDSIKVVVLTGRAGSGKTILSLAAALECMQTYKRFILTRPMSWVGRHNLGAMPGGLDEKFGPYLENYKCNLECLVGGDRKRVDDLIRQTRMEFIPIQLFRGISTVNTWLLVDEAQTLDHHEVVTIGTRVGENSKLVILGDLNQRDERIAKDKTGLYKFVNHQLAQDSTLVASIDLQKCERGPVATLFADIFET